MLGWHMLATTSYAILGLLARRPMSGYDLIVVTEGSVGKFWSMSRAGIYRELARLERLHLVTGADVAQEGRPDKRIYELTTVGRQAFEEWFETTSVDEEGRKLGFLVKFFFARHMRTPLLAQLLTEVADETQRKLDSLVAQHERLDAPGVRFGRLAARHGILAMEARLAWIAEARRDLGLEAQIRP